MEKLENISEGVNYSAVTVGKLENLHDHKFTPTPTIETLGKVFVGKALQSTGTEISFQIMPPSQGVDFLHIHRENEEIYIVVKGAGEFQVDGKIFPVSEGSLIRVAPQGKRAWRNKSNEDMVMICIQCQVNSLEGATFEDGSIINEPVVW